MDAEIDIPIWKDRLDNLLTLRANAFGYPVANFIQYHAVSAVRCIVFQENPAMALTALIPFKIGEFSLGVQLREILLWNDEPTLSPVNKQQAFMNRFQTWFTMTLDGLKKSPSHSREYVVEAVYVQVLVYAALVKCSLIYKEIPQAFYEMVSNQLQTNGVAQKVRWIHNLSSAVLASDHNMVENYKIALWRSEFSDSDFLRREELEKIESFYEGNVISGTDEAAFLQTCKEFQKLIDEANFSRAFIKVKEALEIAKLAKIVDFIDRYQSGFHDIYQSGSHDIYQGCNAALKFLSEPNPTPEQQAFSLKGLNEILEVNPNEIRDLFQQNPPENLLKTLMTLKPLSLEAVLLLGKIFKNLARDSEFYKHDLLSTYSEIKPEVQNPLENEAFQLLLLMKRRREGARFVVKTGGIGATLFVLTAIAIVLVAYFAFPIFALYLTAGILGGFGLITGLIAGVNLKTALQKVSVVNPEIQVEPFVLKKAGGTIPVIQCSLRNWLEAHGYKIFSLTAETFLRLLKDMPTLCDGIDAKRDFDTLTSILDSKIVGRWNYFIGEMASISPAFSKIAAELEEIQDRKAQGEATMASPISQPGSSIVGRWNYFIGEMASISPAFSKIAAELEEIQDRKAQGEATMASPISQPGSSAVVSSVPGVMNANVDTPQSKNI